MGRFTEDLKAQVAAISETRWDGQINSKPVVLMAKPLTSLDMKFVTDKHRDFMSNPNMEGMVELIIRKARIDDGEVAFDSGDKSYLMRLPTTDISDIFRALFGDQIEANADDEIEKKKGN